MRFSQNLVRNFRTGPFNLFQAPLTTCLGSLLWSTPLQNSLISVKISKSWWIPASLSESRALVLIRSPDCLMFTVGIPGKVVFLFWDRFQFIDFLSLVAVTACNSYRRSHLPRRMGHAGLVQQRIRWWPGWWFIQCSPPVGGVGRLCRGSGKHFGKIFFYTL